MVGPNHCSYLLSLMMSAVIPSSLLALAVALTAWASPLSTNTHHAPAFRSPFNLAPMFLAEHPHGTINNSYIVMLKDGLSAPLMQNHMNFLQTVKQADSLLHDGAGLSHVYDGHIKGYAGVFSESTLKQLRAMPEVDFIEHDQIVRTTDIDTQKSAPWVRVTLTAFTPIYDSV
jgi:cerevisin